MSGETGAGMQLAGSIFNEMVMQEAIKDKTAQVQREMEESMAGQIPMNQAEEKEKDSDSDFDSDGDDTIMQALRLKRI